MSFDREDKYETIVCPLCGCAEEIEVIKAIDRLNKTGGEYRLVKCVNCGLMRTNPRPKPEFMSDFYSDDYGPHEDNGLSTQKDGFLKRHLKGFLKKIYKTNSTVLPDLVPGDMLEIGCASGSFLKKMSELGWYVEGIEFAEKPALRAQAAGFNVYSGSIESAPDTGKKFDLIVAWMVLEHLHEPLESLKKLRGWIKDSGMLAMSVPNAQSVDFRLFKDYWYALQLPTHLFHFTPETLTKILQASGWKLERLFHQRTISNYTYSSVWILNESGFKNLSEKLNNLQKSSSIFNYLSYPAGIIAGSLGQSGRMTFWARPV